jgi:prephenate dehydrogenase
VLGLGLIGGSLLRAAVAAGRQAFGYNRSVDGTQAARFDGFDATTDLTEALTRAADLGALIVLAVPMPALPGLLSHIGQTAPQCPLTDVTSVKGAVLDAVSAAGLQAGFVGGHPMTGTAHSGGRRCPAVHRRPMGDQRGRPRRPRGVVDGAATRSGLRVGCGPRQIR